jgi:hypothetical protein
MPIAQKIELALEKTIRRHGVAADVLDAMLQRTELALEQGKVLAKKYLAG